MKSKNRKEYILKTIKEGLKNELTRKEIAESLKITPEKLSILAAQNHIPTNFREIEKKRKANLILSEYKKNPTNIFQMAKKLNFSYTTVRIAYHDLNLKSIKKQKKKNYKVLDEKKTKMLLADLVNTDMTLKAIGKKYKVSQQWVHSLAKKNNIVRTKKNNR